MSDHYEPMDSEEREENEECSRCQPTFEEFKKIVLALDAMIAVHECGLDDEMASKAISEANAAIDGCMPAQCLKALESDRFLTATGELEKLMVRN